MNALAGRWEQSEGPTPLAVAVRMWRFWLTNLWYTRGCKRSSLAPSTKRKIENHFNTVYIAASMTPYH